jgi:hypothetical protein
MALVYSCNSQTAFRCCFSYSVGCPHDVIAGDVALRTAATLRVLQRVHVCDLVMISDGRARSSQPVPDAPGHCTHKRLISANRKVKWWVVCVCVCVARMNTQDMYTNLWKRPKLYERDGRRIILKLTPHLVITVTRRYGACKVLDWVRGFYSRNGRTSA